VLGLRISHDLMNTLFGDAKDLRERQNGLTSGMTLADFGITCGLYLGLIGLERGRQWNAVVEPLEDRLHSL
jgi:hypothetical protein